MKLRALTEDGDWTFGTGLYSYTRKIDAIALAIRTRLRSWKGDCFFALAEGVDYVNYLSYDTKDYLDSNIKRVVLTTEGVLKITNYESELNNSDRKVTIKMSVQTIYGDLEVVF